MYIIVGEEIAQRKPIIICTFLLRRTCAILKAFISSELLFIEHSFLKQNKGK
jgi:hypothetical protein